MPYLGGSKTDLLHNYKGLTHKYGIIGIIGSIL